MFTAPFAGVTQFGDPCGCMCVCDASLARCRRNRCQACGCRADRRSEAWTTRSRQVPAMTRSNVRRAACFRCLLLSCSHISYCVCKGWHVLLCCVCHVRCGVCRCVGAAAVPSRCPHREPSRWSCHAHAAHAGLHRGLHPVRSPASIFSSLTNSLHRKSTSMPLAVRPCSMLSTLYSSLSLRLKAQCCTLGCLVPSTRYSWLLLQQGEARCRSEDNGA
jgi:hypothetical protein